MIGYPIVNIFDQYTLNRIGSLEAYTSLQWRRSWQGVGEWELHASLSATDAHKLKEGLIVMLDNDHSRAGIIRKVLRDETPSRTFAEVHGEELKGLARQRIIATISSKYDTYPYGGTQEPVENVLKYYALRHMGGGHPLFLNRAIENLKVGTGFSRGSQANWLARSGEKLDEVFKAISESYDTGWRIDFDLPTRTLVFDICAGVDRSVNQGVNKRMVFSVGRDNIATAVYEEGIGEYVNAGLAEGKELEDGTREAAWLTLDGELPSGIDRFEGHLDCGEVSASDSLSLSDEGKHQLEALKKIRNLTATVSPWAVKTYRTDWDIGDKVTVRGSGYENDLRISEITEIYEISKLLGIEVVFGNSASNIKQEIRKLKNRKGD